MSRAAEVARRLGEGATVDELAVEWGVTTDSIRRYDRTGRELGVIPEVVSQPIPDIDISNIWDAIEGQTVKEIARSQSQGQASLKFDTQDPIGISFLSDQHLGSLGADMGRMREDAAIIRETPNLFAVLSGDFLDNFIVPKLVGPMRDAVIPIETQWMLVEHYLEMFDDKILAVVGGNHDAWAKKFSGVDVLEKLVKKRKVLHDDSEWQLELNVGPERYKMAIRHKAKYNSVYSETHSAKQLLRLARVPADVEIVVLSHTHNPALEHFRWGANGPRLVIRTGTYKLGDPFVREVGFSPGGHMIPTVILHAGEHYFEGVNRIESAARYLGSIIGNESSLT
jgi:predicted phosphodiesterase